MGAVSGCVLMEGGTEGGTGGLGIWYHNVYCRKRAAGKFYSLNLCT